MTTPNIYRSRILNEISESDVGKTIRVAGWVENIRDHGGVSFIDLRDMYGVLQVVLRDTSLLDGITKETASPSKVSLTTVTRRLTIRRFLQALSNLKLTALICWARFITSCLLRL